MEQPIDSRLPRLRKLVEAMVATLAALLARYRETERALTKNGVELSAAQDEVKTHMNARAELETLSAVGLHRRGLTAEEAACQADDLSGREDGAQERVGKLSGERARLSEQHSADYKEISALVPQIASHGAMLAEVEFLADMGAMIDLDEEHLPSLTEGTHGRIFARTAAHKQYQDRTRRSKSHASIAELLALADEIVRQPIIPLRQRAPQLPHPQSCGLVRDLEQAISASR